MEIPGFDEEILRQMVADADEVTEKLSEYGTLNADEIRSIRENAEKKEQRSVEAAAVPAAPSSGGIVHTSAESDDSGFDNPPEEAGPIADVRKYVICPDCGRKIWL